MARGKKRSNKPANEGSTASTSSAPTVEQIASMPAEQHGDRAERVRAQQQIQAGEQTSPQPPGGRPPGPPTTPGGGGDPAGELGRLAQAIFADTQRPDEPLAAGAPALNAPPMVPDDPDEVLRALFTAFPHSDIGALLDMRRPEPRGPTDFGGSL